jgi:hypothetical protein
MERLSERSRPALDFGHRPIIEDQQIDAPEPVQQFGMAALWNSAV